jgi:hypothetical protein
MLTNDVVHLTWNASDSATNGVVAHYHIFYGPQSHGYLYSIIVGSNVTDVIVPVIVFTTNYFAVTAMDADGNESGFSNEAIYSFPAPTLTITKLNTHDLHYYRYLKKIGVSVPTQDKNKT